MTSSLSAATCILDSQIGKRPGECIIEWSRHVVGPRPARGSVQLRLGRREATQVLEVTRLAAVGCGVELEKNLIDAGSERDPQSRAVVAGQHPIDESRRQPVKQQ